MNAARAFAAALAFAVLACATSPRNVERHLGKEHAPVTTDLSRIDHLVLGIDDLQRGIPGPERQPGVRTGFGAPPPGRGTQNALMSRGGRLYLEIVAPNPAEA